MILFLPPAPHTGAFFDTIRARLSEFETEAATYPGYGRQSPISEPSIQGYAQSLLPAVPNSHLVGFHTGCLVALEMAQRDENIDALTLIDVPYFDEVTKARHRSELDAENPTHSAFFAAFNYDLDRALRVCTHAANVIATRSSLLEPTREAAQTLKHSNYVERLDISKPAFEQTAMAELLASIFFDNSQTRPSRWN